MATIKNGKKKNKTIKRNKKDESEEETSLVEEPEVDADEAELEDTASNEEDEQPVTRKKNNTKNKGKNSKSAKADVKADVKADAKAKKGSKTNKKDKNPEGKKKKRNIEADIADDNKILVVTTTKTGPFKQAIERISNVISDCSIVFVSPNDDDDKVEEDEYYEEIDGQVEVKKPKTKNSKKKSKIVEEDDDEDDEEEEMNDDDDQQQTAKIKKTNKTQTQGNKNKGGIRIVRLTEDKSILIKLNLYAEFFEYFRCDEPKITIGVDMLQFHALLKTINDNNAIMMYMNKDNRSALYIRAINENEDSNEETDIEVYLLDIPNQDIRIPVTKFQNWIIMAGDKFNNICKHLHNNSTYVEIASVNNQIQFKGYSEGGKITLTYRDTKFSPNDKSKTKIVQGVYELKHLLSFSKCNKLCDELNIYLKNDFPLVLVLAVANLGKMYVFMTPVEHPNNN